MSTELHAVRRAMSDVRQFYDGLADAYHLIFEDWNRSIARQGEALATILERWPMPTRRVLDAAVGIGTQALGLAARGFDVIGTDLAPAALGRARREAALRALHIELAAADFRQLPFASAALDAAIVCDNAIPHLTSLTDIRVALRELARCVRPGGGVVLSMRDYPATSPAAGTTEHHPYGERDWNGRRVIVEQEWLWEGETYRVTLRVRPVEPVAAAPLVVVETIYLAVPVVTVLEAMRDIGLVRVERVDDVYYQPLLIGTVPATCSRRSTHV